MDYRGFITTVERETATPTEEAERAVRATLQTLAERISGGEADDIAQQLPPELRPLLQDGKDAQRFDADEFVRRVAEREGTAPATAARHARAVFAALGRAVSRDELADMASELPRDFSAFVEAATARREAQPSETQDVVMPVEAFYHGVARRAGLDARGAERATDAVLEALADRISGGEVDDLKRALPRELHAPLERGKAQSSGAARRMSLDDFVRGIAEREGVTPAEARVDARAVFAMLREALPDKEFADVAAQLPDDYRSLLART